MALPGVMSLLAVAVGTNVSAGDRHRNQIISHHFPGNGSLPDVAFLLVSLHTECEVQSNDSDFGHSIRSVMARRAFNGCGNVLWSVLVTL